MQLLSQLADPRWRLLVGGLLTSVSGGPSTANAALLSLAMGSRRLAGAFAERSARPRLGAAPARVSGRVTDRSGFDCCALELGRQGFGSVGAPKTAAPVRELTLSTRRRHSGRESRRLNAVGQASSEDCPSLMEHRQATGRFEMIMDPRLRADVGRMSVCGCGHGAAYLRITVQRTTGIHFSLGSMLNRNIAQLMSAQMPPTDVLTFSTRMR